MKFQYFRATKISAAKATSQGRHKITKKGYGRVFASNSLVGKDTLLIK